MATNRKGMFVSIAVVAVIGVAAVLYFAKIPPVPDDATGAIGAAERYRAEQITDADVELAGESAGDAAAAASIVTGEELVELLGKASMQEKAAFFERLNMQERVNIFQRAMRQEALGRYAMHSDFGKVSRQQSMERSSMQSSQ